MNRKLIAIMTFVALAFAGSALAAARHPAKVNLARSSLGKILVNGAGRTLYMFTTDRKNKDNCQGINGCTVVWFPLTTHGRPVAGKGVRRSLLGTITMTNGAKQVTYAGHPLYTYSIDSGRAQTDYVGVPQFGGTWFALNAAGKKVG